MVNYCFRLAGGSGTPSESELQQTMHGAHDALVQLRQRLTLDGGGIGCLKCFDGNHRWACKVVHSGNENGAWQHWLPHARRKLP